MEDEDSDYANEVLVQRNVGPGRFSLRFRLQRRKPAKGRLCAYLSHFGEDGQSLVDRRVSRRLAFRRR
jgi:hypothetical protein